MVNYVVAKAYIYDLSNSSRCPFACPVLVEFCFTFPFLVGLCAFHFLYVKNIDLGRALLELHGFYKASSSGKMNINSYGWMLDGFGRTEYSA